MRIPRNILGIVEGICNKGVIISYIAFTIVAVSTLVDVFCRYVLGRPILGVIEINERMIPIMIFMALAMTQRYRGHISVTVFVSKLSPRRRVRLDIFTYILGFVFVSIIGWATLENALIAFYNKQTVLIGIERFPIWWARFFVPMGLWLLSLQYIADIANCYSKKQVR